MHAHHAQAARQQSNRHALHMLNAPPLADDYTRIRNELNNEGRARLYAARVARQNAILQEVRERARAQPIGVQYAQ